MKQFLLLIVFLSLFSCENHNLDTSLSFEDVMGMYEYPSEEQSSKGNTFAFYKISSEFYVDVSFSNHPYESFIMPVRVFAADENTLGIIGEQNGWSLYFLRTSLLDNNVHIISKKPTYKYEYKGKAARIE